MAHTHSHREPAGGGSGQAKPREQSEAGGSYPHPRCERGRPLEQLFGSAGVRQVWAQVCRLLVPMPEALLEGCADTSPATVPLGTIR